MMEDCEGGGSTRPAKRSHNIKEQGEGRWDRIDPTSSEGSNHGGRDLLAPREGREAILSGSAWFVHDVCSAMSSSQTRRSEHFFS